MGSNRGDDVSKEVVRIENVSVTYTVRHANSRSLKEVAIKSITTKRSDVEVKALNNLSLSFYSGEVIVVLGANGAGKSTLLKLLARVLPPNTGRVVVDGTISPMIQLGAGFNYELTGIENIALYGVLLGYTKSEINEAKDAIIAWSELSDFIHLPIRTYSSGMIARLAFAIATHRTSDLILIDELLSVGDQGFQLKSQRRIHELISTGACIILVTHDLAAAKQYGDRAIWLDKGNLILEGDIARVLEKYSHA
jgi:ABC-2 type transport system ATP-binding protein